MGTTPNGIVYPDPAGVPARADLQTLAESVETALASIWTGQVFTPTPTSGISAFGNASRVNRYMHAGDHVSGFAHITMGSTTTFSAGAFILTLPVPALVGANQSIGTMFIQDASVGLSSRRGGTVVTASSTTVYFLADDVANNVVTNTAPWTWAVNDVFSFSFAYEAA